MLTTLHTAHRNTSSCRVSSSATPSTGTLLPLLPPARRAAALTAAAAVLPTAGWGRLGESREESRAGESMAVASRVMMRSRGETWGGHGGGGRGEGRRRVGESLREGGLGEGKGRRGGSLLSRPPCVASTDAFGASIVRTQQKYNAQQHNLHPLGSPALQQWLVHTRGGGATLPDVMQFAGDLNVSTNDKEGRRQCGAATGCELHRLAGWSATLTTSPIQSLSCIDQE